MTRCPECGYEYRLDRAALAGPAIVAGVAEQTALLCGRAADLRTRRHPDQWSPLEYGCHVRDVLLVQRERVLAARRTERPSSPPMGRDERVEHDGYAEQNPADVARQLDDAAYLFANVLARLDDAEWERTVIYNFPAPAERTLRWVAEHTLHEVVHHLADMRRQLGTVD